MYRIEECIDGMFFRFEIVKIYKKINYFPQKITHFLRFLFLFDMLIAKNLYNYPSMHRFKGYINTFIGLG